LDELSTMFNVALTLEHSPQKNLVLLTRNMKNMGESALANKYKKPIDSSKGFIRSQELTAKWNQILAMRIAKSGMSAETVAKFKWFSVLTCSAIQPHLKDMYAEIDPFATGQHPLKYRKAWFYGRPAVDLERILRDHIVPMSACVTVIAGDKGMKDFNAEWPANQGEAATLWLQNAQKEKTKEYYLSHTYFCDPTWGAFAADYAQSPDAYKEFIASLCVTVQQWANGSAIEVKYYNKGDEGFKATKKAVAKIRYNIRNRVFAGTGRQAGGITRIAGKAKILTF